MNPVQPFPGHGFPRGNASRANPGWTNTVYDWLKFETIGGCSHMAPSPDGKYLAYSTRACTSESSCGEVVKILETGAQEAVTIQFMPPDRKRWVIVAGMEVPPRTCRQLYSYQRRRRVYVFGEPFVENHDVGEIVAGGELRQWNESRDCLCNLRCARRRLLRCQGER